MPKRKETLVEVAVSLIVLVSVLGAVGYVPKVVADSITGLLISALPGIIVSVVAANIVENLTGDALKTIFLNVELFGVNFSISAFVIATFIVKTLIFPS